MNMQDIADFISLVKDPAKFEKALKDLQDEQDRLKAVVETVGKASELDSLRKKLEKDVAKKMAALDEKFALVDDSAARAEAQVKQLKLELQDQTNKAREMQNVATVKEQQAQDLVQSFSGRDKAIQAQEKQVAELRATLSKSVTEYEEKLAKLRTVIL